jgi:hypothetical protein
MEFCEVHMHPVRSLSTVAILAIAAVSAYAQPIISAKSGVIASVEGKVLVDNAELQESVTHFPEVKEGSVLRTEDGRVELMLPPGFMLRMGENGALKMVSNRLIDTRVELQAGSAVVEVDQTKPDCSVSILLKDGVVNLSKVGVYRFDSEPARIKVYHGLATVEIGGQSVMVATGKMLALSGASASAEKFDVAETDSLDNWSQHRAEAMAMANLSGAKYSNDNYATSNAGNTWVFNPYYGMYTYMPGMGTMCNPYYGLCYYSPMSAYRAFYYGPVSGYGNSIPSYGYKTGAASVFAGGGSTSYTSMHGATGASSTATGARGGGGTSGAFSGGHVGGGSAGGGGTGGRGK